MLRAMNSSSEEQRPGSSSPDVTPEGQQTLIYENAYSGARRLRRLLRYDIRYRCRRLHEVARQLDVDLERKYVLDFGFGGGDLLASFPRSCHVVGTEISRSAVERAAQEARFRVYAKAEFHLAREGHLDDVPAGPFDVIVSAHVLEHVPDDRAALAALYQRLRPGGIAFLFVPIEEPNYNPDHVRNYSPEQFRAMVEAYGFEVMFAETSMHIQGHVWKWITIPSRRRWPVLGNIVNGFRLCMIAPVPHRLVRSIDAALDAAGVGPRQMLVVGRKPG